VTSLPRLVQYASKSRYHQRISGLHLRRRSSSLSPLIICSSASPETGVELARNPSYNRIASGWTALLLAHSDGLLQGTTALAVVNLD
jgi:hypothetical protein